MKNSQIIPALVLGVAFVAASFILSSGMKALGRDIKSGSSQSAQLLSSGIKDLGRDIRNVSSQSKSLNLSMDTVRLSLRNAGPHAPVKDQVFRVKTVD